MKEKVAFVCVHNSCRSQIAEVLGKSLVSEIFESYSAGTETKPQINQDAVRLMKVQRGSGGASIAKPLDEITFFDIYQAVECVEHGELFHFHENPNQKCPVGRNIHNVLDGKLIQIQDALENELGKITLEDVMKDTQYYIAKERE